MAPELHHCAHAALAAILLAPFPVHATHYSHAHLHACLGVRVHGGRGCLGPVSREHPQAVSGGHRASLPTEHLSKGPPGQEGRPGAERTNTRMRQRGRK